MNFFGSIAILVVVAVPWNRRFILAYVEMRRGMLAYAAGDFESASRRLAAATARVPECSWLEGAATYIEGMRLLAADHNEEALERFRAALKNAPPGANIEAMIARSEIGIAYQRKDYRGFLAIAQKQLALAPKSAEAAAEVASAYACLYASEGRDADKDDSLRHLELARGLKEKDAPWWAEYEQRIRHRLTTKTIIDRAEFVKRYPNGWKEGS